MIANEIISQFSSFRLNGFIQLLSIKGLKGYVERRFQQSFIPDPITSTGFFDKKAVHLDYLFRCQSFHFASSSKAFMCFDRVFLATSLTSSSLAASILLN